MIRKVKQLAVGLAFALTALGGPALAGNLDGALKFVPADFTTVVAIDLDSMRNSPLFKLALANMGGAQEFGMLKAEVGVDIPNDVKSFVFAGPDELMRHSERFLGVAEVRVDAARFATFVKSQGDTVTEKKVRGATLLVIDGEIAFAVDGGFFVFGAPALVEQALAAKGGRDVTSGPLGALIKQFRGSKTGFAVLAAGSRVQRFLGEGVPEFSQLQRAGLGLDLTSGLSVKVAGTFANAAAASAVAEALTQALAEIAEDPEVKEAGMAGFASKLTARANETGVAIDLTLDAAETRHLTKALEQMQ